MYNEKNDMIIDEDVPRAYRTETPNIVFDLLESGKISYFAFVLYSVYKRTAGQNGKCWKSIRTLAVECGFSHKKVIEARRELEQHFDLLKGNSLITVIKGDPHKNKTDIVKIHDIWKCNHDHFLNKFFEKEEGRKVVLSAPGWCHQHQGGAVVQQKKEPYKNIKDKNNKTPNPFQGKSAIALDENFSSLSIFNGFPYFKHAISPHGAHFPMTFTRPDGTTHMILEDQEISDEILQSPEYQEYDRTHSHLFQDGKINRLCECKMHRRAIYCDANCILERLNLEVKSGSNSTTQCNISCIIPTLIDEKIEQNAIIVPDNLHVNNKNQIVSKQKEKRPKEFSTEVVALSKKMINILKESDDRYLLSCSLEKFHKSIDLMLNRDKRSEAHIMQAFLWGLNDEKFWRPHFFTGVPSALVRKKFVSFLQNSERKTPEQKEQEKKARILENERLWSTASASAMKNGEKKNIKVETKVDSIIIGKDEIYYDAFNFIELVANALRKVGFIQ